MNAEFLNPKTAFNGVEGWLTINALDMIDPMPKKGAGRRFKIKQEAVTTDGTIFVYVTQTQLGQQKC